MCFELVQAIIAMNPGPVKEERRWTTPADGKR
jgi:hypothetical protein